MIAALFIESVVGFADWESGRVKLTDEVFDPILGDVIGYTAENGKVREHRKVVGYRGRVTGTRLGTWFGEVMEPEANISIERKSESESGSRLIKPDYCEICLEKKQPRQIHGHHDDYEKIFNVQWLCSKCHAKEHGRYYKQKED